MQTFTPFEYLCIDLANHFGLDKEDFNTRIKWVKDNWKALEAYTDEADEPVLYHKAVMNIRSVVKGEASGHMVALDAVCSGIQIMSAITGCKYGAAATALTFDKRADAYTAVQERMNQLLQKEGIKINVPRKDIKQAVMTAAYGSIKVPQQVFGEGDTLDCFYRACNDVAKGAFELLEVLRKTWKPYALHHEWILPDAVQVSVKVMQKVEKRLEVQELGGYQMTTQWYENQGKEHGVSNIANIVHSLDAYMVRSMVRRCNYNPPKVKRALAILTAEDITETTVDGMLSDLIWVYEETKMIDSVIIDYLDENTVGALSETHRKHLIELLTRMLEHKPFEICTVHDAFMCLPSNANQMRYWYKEIMAEFAESNVLSFILSTMKGSRVTYRKYSNNLGDLIRNGVYAIC